MQFCNAPPLVQDFEHESELSLRDEHLQSFEGLQGVQARSHLPCAHAHKVFDGVCRPIVDHVLALVLAISRLILRNLEVGSVANGVKVVEVFVCARCNLRIVLVQKPRL